MTTTGEYLVSLSSLDIGTAEEHLLAISGGLGTVFIDRLEVAVSDGPSVVVPDDGMYVTIAKPPAVVIEEEE